MIIQKTRTTDDSSLYVLITRLSREEIQRGRLSNLIIISTSSRMITWFVSRKMISLCTRDRTITRWNKHNGSALLLLHGCNEICGTNRFRRIALLWFQFRFRQADLTNARSRLLFGSRSERMIDYSYNYSCRKVLSFCTKPAQKRIIVPVMSNPLILAVHTRCCNNVY